MLAATVRASGSRLRPAVQGPVDARWLRGGEQSQKPGIGPPGVNFAPAKGLEDLSHLQKGVYGLPGEGGAP